MEQTMLDTSALMYIVDRPPLVMVRGEGSWLWDHTGKKYLDFVQGWAVNALGHSPRVVVEALKAQAEILLNPSPAYYNAPMIELADLLVKHSVFDRVFFANCGAEANEGAIKLARKWGQVHKHGAYEIITMDHAFHGRTLATMSASGKAPWVDLFEPKVSGFPKVEFNNITAVERAINERTVGIMLEPVQGEAGVYPVSDENMRALRSIADEAGILLIVDEVQTGVGRTGKLFAYEHAGIEPDIMTLAKGIGGGVPLAALLAKEEVCCFVPGDQGGTYCGNPLMTAAGAAVMQTVTAPGFLENVNEMGAYLAQRLQALSQELNLGEVRGRGLLLALNLKQPVSRQIAADAMDAGLLINAPQPESLRFMPSLLVTKDEIDLLMEMLAPVVRKHVS
jgi:acetylornithine/N-succinyldiaminopimelate aminotransferase